MGVFPFCADELASFQQDYIFGGCLVKPAIPDGPSEPLMPPIRTKSKTVVPPYSCPPLIPLHFSPGQILSPCPILHHPPPTPSLPLPGVCAGVPKREVTNFNVQGIPRRGSMGQRLLWDGRGSVLGKFTCLECILAPKAEFSLIQRVIGTLERHALNCLIGR